MLTTMGAGGEPTSQRLTLRLPELPDLGDMIAMWSDAQVVRHIGGRPFTAEETWQRLLRYRGHWALQGFGYWAIRERSTGSFVGEIGFADWKRDGLPELDGLPECGWALAPAKQGIGYAAEALDAALAWLDGTLGPTPSACIIMPENVRSIRLAEAHGYSYDHAATYKGTTPGIFVRPPRHPGVSA